MAQSAAHKPDSTRRATYQDVLDVRPAEETKVNGFDWRRTWNVLAATIVALFVIASAAQEPERTHTLPYLPSASDALGRTGVARVINHSDEAGEVRIDAFDDEGQSYGPVTLSLDAGEAVHFHSEHLENGNEERGLSGALGSGEGAWRLELSSELDIEVLSYVITADGLLTAMHDTAPSAGGRHRVAIFNPGSNTNRVSRLRLVNLGEEAAEVSIVGIDDRSESAASEVTTTIPAGASRTFTAAALESGGEGLEGALGDGEGKWRLVVESSQPIVVIGLLSDSVGHLSNLSAAGVEPERPKPPEEVRNVGTVLDEWLSREGKTTYEAAADHCEHIIPSHPFYVQCLENQLNTSHVHMLNVVVADEHMLCILDAFWNERERDEQIMERLRRFSFAAENSFSNDYRGANSWQGAEGLSDCRELRPDFSGDDTRSSVRTVLEEWLSREGRTVREAAEGQCAHIIPTHPSYCSVFGESAKHEPCTHAECRSRGRTHAVHIGRVLERARKG